MFSKKIYCIALVFFAFLLKAQNAPIQISFSKNEIKNYEAVLNQEKSFEKDTVALKNFLKPLYQNKNYSVFYEAANSGKSEHPIPVKESN